MFCHVCGTQISDDARFCHKCGAKVVTDASNIELNEKGLEAVNLLIIFKNIGSLGSSVMVNQELDVTVDGKKVGQLRNGETAEYKILPGQHHIALGPVQVCIETSKGNGLVQLMVQPIVREEGALEYQLSCEPSCVVIPDLSDEEIYKMQSYQNYVAGVSNEKMTMLKTPEENCCTKVVKSETTNVPLEAKPKIPIKLIIGVTIVLFCIIAIHNFIKKGAGFSYNDFDDGAMGYNELIEDYYGRTPKFDRSFYIENAVSVNDFLRYGDNGPCYFERYVVDSVAEERVYICRNDTGSSWIVIDDRGRSSNSNAIPGDMVTVYGRYSDIVEVTFTDGRINNQVPMVYADKLINNNVFPEDQEEFIQQMINSMNLSDNFYGSESEYYGNYHARIVVGVDYSLWEDGSDSYTVKLNTGNFYGYRINPVDGYRIAFELVNDAENPYQSGAISDEDLKDEWWPAGHRKYGKDIPVYANVVITSMEMLENDLNMDMFRGAVSITFCIESFEAYSDYSMGSNSFDYNIGSDMLWAENDYGLSDFSYNTLFLYGGSYEGNHQTSIDVNIYSSLGEGNTVGNVFLYDSLGHETYALIRDDNEGEGIYTLCFDDLGSMYIKFYQDFYGGYYVDIQGLDNIYTNVNGIETYVMTEQYIP